MNAATPCPEDATRAPQEFRDALAELVRIGVSVARMVEQIAEAETAYAVTASQPGPPDAFAPPAGSLAEAIEADQAAAAAAQARQSSLARAEAIAATFASVARSTRLTVLLAERLDRGWARRPLADDRDAMARRQVARGVADAIASGADGERAQILTAKLAERLERLDTEPGIGDRPAEEIIREICRDLGIDPARLTAPPSLPDAVASPRPGRTAGDGRPRRPPPDG